MSERRRSARSKSFLRGCVLFNNGRSALDCLVRDVSAAGARLIFTEPAAIPDTVDLHIPQKDKTLHAHVQWREGQEIGVTFAAASPTLAPSREIAELTERVQQLEVEVASLRRMLKRFKAQVAAGDKPNAA
jgi:hypothetical protein